MDIGTDIVLITGATGQQGGASSAAGRHVGFVSQPIEQVRAWLGRHGCMAGTGIEACRRLVARRRARASIGESSPALRSAARPRASRAPPS